MARKYNTTPDYPSVTLPLNGTEITEIWQGGKQKQGPLSLLGGTPSSHAESHKNGGADEVGTETPAGYAIPKADSDGTIDAWVSDGSTSKKGKVQIAASGESSAGKVMASDDARGSNARTPLAHQESHITGSDQIPIATTSEKGLLSAAMAIKLAAINETLIPTTDQKAALAGSTGTPSASNKYLTSIEKGAALGLVPLNASSKIDTTYLPSYVDDVVEVANYAALPVTGESGKIYVTLDTNLTYRWSGSAYVEISPSLALGETSSTAYVGNRGKIAYDHSQSAHAPVNADNTQATINSAAEKTTPVDADVFTLLDSAASNVIKKLSWTNIKATLKTYFDAIYSVLVLGETPTTAYRGDRGKTAYDHSQSSGNPHGTAISDISTLQGKITPISDASRNMYVNGDGIPIIPDGSSGIVYSQTTWATTDGWSGIGATATLPGNGCLRLTKSGANQYIQHSFASDIPASIYRLRIRLVSGSTVNGKLEMDFRNSGGGYIGTVFLTLPTDGTWAIVDTYVTFAGIRYVWLTPGTYADSTAAVVDINIIHIGSGLYDTPVYDKACCNRLINNGALPVKGLRGQAIQVIGAHYLQADNKLIGSSWTIARKFKRSTIGTLQTFFDNTDSSGLNGVRLFVNASNNIIIRIANASTYQDVTIASGVTDITNWHSCGATLTGLTLVCYYDAVLISTTTLSITPTISNTAATICRESGNAQNYEIGLFNDVIAYGNIWALNDFIRYHNGEVPLDSQQKAQTPVGYSIMTRKMDGRTEVATGTSDFDATNKLQMDTAITAAVSTILAETFVAADTFASKQLGYLGSDGQIHLFDASAESTAKGALYIATAAVTATNSGSFQRMGEITTTGLTAGATYYGSETAGGYTTTAPTTSGAVVRIIGYAQSTTILFFSPSNDYVVLI